MKVAINACYGGFNLSNEAIKRYAEIKGIEIYFITPRHPHDYSCKEYLYYEDVINASSFNVFTVTKPLKDGIYDRDSWFTDRDIPRDDPALIQVVEELKESANGSCAELCIIEIPDGTDWQIEEYDGFEHIAEKHQTWGS